MSNIMRQRRPPALVPEFADVTIEDQVRTAVKLVEPQA
jgi:stage V sporulation protein SpoVS